MNREYRVVTLGRVPGLAERELNRLAAEGWRVVAGGGRGGMVVLERERPAPPEPAGEGADGQETA